MLQAQPNSNHYALRVDKRLTTVTPAARFGDTTVRKSIVVRVSGSPSNVAQPIPTVEDVAWLAGAARDMAHVMDQVELEDPEEYERWLSDFI